MEEEGKKMENAEINILKENVSWDFILHQSQLFLIVIDNYLKIHLINIPLCKILGFKTEHDLIGKDWLKFIKPDEKKITQNIYTKLLSCNDFSNNNYVELTNNIILPNKDIISIKWINVIIKENLIFSFGFKNKEIDDKDEIDDINSFRQYYQNILQKDRLMIQSYQDTFNINM